MRKQPQPPSRPAAPEPEKFERWTAQRKAAIILEILRGKISVPEAARRHGFTRAEFMGTLKLECVWQRRFETYDEAKAAIAAWVKHYNEMRPHSRLGYVPPAAWRQSHAGVTA
ncbi:MAG TPA: integrase core domain-containing protein [Candidatus Cybelea sp.]|nr:integrase core domain-containing protein [Candidatus Cybelea sp.]